MRRDSLLGKRVVITGASRGIGEAVTRLAVSQGARVALIGLEPERLRALATELGQDAVWGEGDVRDGAALRRAIDQAAEDLGGIDVIVANAGVVGHGTIRQTSDDSFERVIDINLNGVFRTLKYATRYLEQTRGHALVVASAASFAVLPGNASYSPSKAGVEMLGLTYRQEVAHLGISVGVAHLSFVDTDLVKAADLAMPSFAVMRSKLPYPMRKLVKVDHAAAGIVKGIVTRRSRVYVPNVLLLGNWLRPVLASPLMWPWARRLAAKFVPLLERDAAMFKEREPNPTTESRYR